MNFPASFTTEGGEDPTTSDLPTRARREFPALGRVRYLDTATRAPMAASVRASMEGFLATRVEGLDGKEQWRPTVEAVRSSFARLIGAATHEVALMQNTSYALNALAHSIPWRTGDNVVVSAAEHPNNLFPWLHLGRRYGVEVRLAPGTTGSLEVEDLSRLVDARTRVVALSLVGFMSGTRAEIEEIAQVCRGEGAYLVVDAIQAAGVLPIDVLAAGIDALACGGHKGLLSPFGAGFLFCRADRLAEWEPAYAARSGIRPADGSYSYVEEPHCRFLPSAARYEVGNYNYEGLHGQDVALRFLLSFDPNEVADHVLALAWRLDQGLRALDMAPLNPPGDNRRSGIVSFRSPDAAHLQAELGRRRTVVALKGDVVRVSLHLFNNSDDVDGLLDELKSLLRR